MLGHHNLTDVTFKELMSGQVLSCHYSILITFELEYLPAGVKRLTVHDFIPPFLLKIFEKLNKSFR